MGTRYSTLGVGQSYIMFRVFENADNNPIEAILEELDPPCPHATSCAHSWPPTRPRPRRGTGDDENGLWRGRMSSIRVSRHLRPCWIYHPRVTEVTGAIWGDLESPLRA